jgi:hypothetical protein
MKQWLHIVVLVILSASSGQAVDSIPLTLDWKDNILTIYGDHLPGK